jgi:hypothetical protein
MPIDLEMDVTRQRAVLPRFTHSAPRNPSVEP